MKEYFNDVAKLLKSTMLVYINLFSLTLGVESLLIFADNHRIEYATGESMLPTFQSGTYFLANTSEEALNNITYNDFISFLTEEGFYLKRVVAVGGDTVEIENAQLIVNGKVVEEDYILEPEWEWDDFHESCLTENGKLTVPEGEYFVLGDHRNHSTDSRSISVKTVAQKQVKSVVKPFFNQALGKSLYELQQAKQKTN